MYLARWLILLLGLTSIFLLYLTTDSTHNDPIKEFKKTIQENRPIIYVEKPEPDSGLVAQSTNEMPVEQTTSSKVKGLKLKDYLATEDSKRTQVTHLSGKDIFTNQTPLLALKHGIYKLDQNKEINTKALLPYYVQFTAPITENEKQIWQDEGIQFKHYIHPQTWLVEAESSTSLEALAESNQTYAMAAMPIQDKLESSLLNQTLASRAHTDDYLIQLSNAKAHSKIARFIKDSGGKIKSDNDMSIKAELSVDTLLELAKSNHVSWIEKAEQAHRLTGSQSDKALIGAKLKVNEFKGKGIKVGLWDGDPKEASKQHMPHAKYMASIIKGYESGMPAVAADSELYQFNRNAIENLVEDVEKQIKQNDLLISIHNYGPYSSCKIGSYNYKHYNWDRMLSRNEEHLAFHSIGNDYSGGCKSSSDETPSSTNGRAISKNNISIGAHYSQITKDTISPLLDSIQGPTSDGRVKPDLVAEGAVMHNMTHLCSDDDCGYIGSSVANTLAAAKSALVLEKFISTFKRRAYAAELKSLLIHTADDLGLPGPDYRYGWGRLNAKRAMAKIDDKFAFKTIRFDRVNRENYLYIPVNETESALKVTMAWSEPGGHPAAMFGLVHNLDMTLISPSGESFSAWYLDPGAPKAQARLRGNYTDNVEQISIKQPELGVWKLKVHISNALTTSEQSAFLTSNLKFQEE